MRIFVAGAPGIYRFGAESRVDSAGHQVLGLTRSEAGAEKLRRAGGEVPHGNIEGLDCLRRGAAGSHGVIHLAFNHDFSQFQKNADDDRKAIGAIARFCCARTGRSLSPRVRRFAANVDGKPSTEDGPTVSWNPRAASEAAVKELTARGVNTSLVRLPKVHDTRSKGWFPIFSPWRARRAFRSTSGTAAITGRRRMFPT